MASGRMNGWARKARRKHSEVAPKRNASECVVEALIVGPWVRWLDMDKPLKTPLEIAAWYEAQGEQSD